MPSMTHRATFAAFRLGCHSGLPPAFLRITFLNTLCLPPPSCRAALAEFRLGCPERGRSVFEGVLVNYTKRTDLWNVYLDQVGGDTFGTYVRS